MGESERRLLSPQEVRAWMASVSWRFAKTMPKHPHHYTLKRNQDPELFEDVVWTIWLEGFDRQYLGRPWRSYNVGVEHFVWVVARPSPGRPPPLEETILINGARRQQGELF